MPTRRRVIQRVAFVIALPLLVMIACDSGYEELPAEIPLLPYEPPDTVGDHFARRDSAGVKVIRSAGSGAWGPDMVSATRTRRIGAVGGDEAFTLDDVRSIAIDPAGAILAASGRWASVSLFDSDGGFIGRIGRSGDGPGEFDTADHLWVGGDTAFVSDYTLQRTTAFRIGDGEVLASWTRSDSGEWARPVARGARGWMAEVGPPIRVRPLPVGTLLPSEISLHEFAPEAGVVGPLLVRIDMPEQRRLAPTVANVALPLFEVPPDYGFDDEGRAFITSNTGYEIEVYDATGALVRRITREYVPLEAGETEIQAIGDFIETVFARDSLLRPYSSHEAEKLEFRKRLHPLRTRVPPLAAILVSGDGSFWVERGDAAPPGLRDLDGYWDRRPLPIARRWDLFSDAGEFLGTVETPIGFDGMAVRGLEITGIERDENLVEYIVTYRVDPSEAD